MSDSSKCFEEKQSRKRELGVARGHTYAGGSFVYAQVEHLGVTLLRKGLDLRP